MRKRFSSSYHIFLSVLITKGNMTHGNRNQNVHNCKYDHVAYDVLTVKCVYVSKSSYLFLLKDHLIRTPQVVIQGRHLLL